MPIQFTVSPDGDDVLVVATGTVTPEEYVEAASRQLGSGGAPIRVRCHLCDWSAADPAALTTEALRFIADLTVGECRRFPGERRFAHVATRPGVYGLIRMWHSYADAPGMTSEVFRSREEAERWLAEQRRLFAAPGGDLTRPADGA